MFVKSFLPRYDDSLILNIRRSEDTDKRYPLSTLQNSFALHTSHVIRKRDHIDLMDMDHMSPNSTMNLPDDLLFENSHDLPPLG